MKDEFVHHQPTKEQDEKYVEIRRACANLIRCFEVVMTRRTASKDVFSMVNEAARAFHETIDTLCPESEDKAFAKRMVRLSKMTANEIITADDWHGMYRAIDFATQARMWACASIALAD